MGNSGSFRSRIGNGAARAMIARQRLRGPDGEEMYGERSGLAGLGIAGSAPSTSRAPVCQPMASYDAIGRRSKRRDLQRLLDLAVDQSWIALMRLGAFVSPERVSRATRVTPAMQCDTSTAYPELFPQTI